MTAESEYAAWLQSNDGGNCTMVRFYPEGVYAAVRPMLFHYDLIFGDTGNKFSFHESWSYKTRALAEKALTEWNGYGEPTGWHRHPPSGRRRPHGDPNQEYIAA